MIGVITHLTSRSPAMMCELRKLFLLIGEFDIKVRTTYIRSAANIWTDGLNRIKDHSDWKLRSNIFGRLIKLRGPSPSTVSPPSKTNRTPVTMPSGETDGQKQSTPSTSRTTHGIESSTSATPHGSCWTTSRQNFDRLELPRLSSHASGPDALGSHSSPRLLPRQSRCPPFTTSSLRIIRWGAGGGRAFRLERRGLHGASPARLLMRGRQLQKDNSSQERNTRVEQHKRPAHLGHSSDDTP